MAEILFLEGLVVGCQTLYDSSTEMVEVTPGFWIQDICAHARTPANTTPAGKEANDG